MKTFVRDWWPELTVALAFAALVAAAGLRCRGEGLAAAKPTPAVEVHFSPHGGCTAAVIKEIDGGESEILVACYSFTSKPIEQALAAAVKRGVAVRLIQDEPSSRQHGSLFLQAKADGIEVHTDAQHAIFHDKIMLIDGRTIITGSFNFTHNAEESNAENCLTIRDKPLAKEYADNWREHLQHADKAKGAK